MEHLVLESAGRTPTGKQRGLNLTFCELNGGSMRDPCGRIRTIINESIMEKFWWYATMSLFLIGLKNPLQSFRAVTHQVD